MAKLIITKGLQASGKSTWAREFVEKNKDWVRINRDDLRNMRGTYWLPKQEKLITAWENACLFNALDMGYNVILDATNLNKKFIDSKLKALETLIPDLKIEYKKFDVSPEECIRRDLKRENSVGAKVIWDTYNKYFKEKEVQTLPDFTRNPSLQDAIIIDLDGTYALFNGRDPYDAGKCETDIVNEAVRAVAEGILARGRESDHNTAILLVSGRMGTFKEQTESWLTTNGIYYTELHMRKEGDVRKDSIIKAEIYNDHIRGKYNTLFVLDDRDQTVEGWRELGLQCLQVAEGNF